MGMKWFAQLFLVGFVASSVAQSSPEIVWSEGQGQFMSSHTTASPDGKWVYDGTGKIRHTDTLQLRIAMDSITGNPASFSAHSQWLMTCGTSGIRFFLPFLDLQTGELKATTSTPQDVLGIEVNGNQGFVAVDDREAVLWARVGGIWMLQFKWPVAPNQLTGAIAISPDRKHLAVGPTSLLFESTTL
jgi:hypothetical protein